MLTICVGVLVMGKVFGDTYQRSIVFAHAIFILLNTKL